MADTFPGFTYVPTRFHYLCNCAEKYGLRGLTVRFDGNAWSGELASPAELMELQEAYELIKEKGDAPLLQEWCLSEKGGPSANEAKEILRGLLLLFERLGDIGVMPFADLVVRYISPPPPHLNWSPLPSHLSIWIKWLRKFEHLQTEADIYRYVQEADFRDQHQLDELVELVKRHGDQLQEWCQQTNVLGNPQRNEAFQAEWLFVLADSVRRKANRARGNTDH